MARVSPSGLNWNPNGGIKFPMSVLRDPKLEKFAESLAGNIAAGMKRGEAALEAAQAAGFSGRSIAANARKRANRPDVKLRVAELLAPALAKADESLGVTVEWATNKLFTVADYDLGKKAVKIGDQLRAIELLAKIRGWMAPEQRDVTIHEADKMTDDELARIAAGGSPSAAPSAVSS